jgi:LmbE family N-acetylglucosaminyl deacetylase
MSDPDAAGGDSSAEAHFSGESRRQTILALVPHPDDEAYAMAGLLAQAARGGARVVVVSATAGEGGYDHLLLDRSPIEMGAARRAELAASCAAIGAEAPRFLGWADGAVADVGSNEASAVLIDIFRTVEPEIVVSLGADGAYGHADHLALWRLMTRVFDAWPQDGTDPPRWLSAEFPSGLFEPQWRHMTQGRHADRVADETPALGIAGGEVGLRVRLDGPARSAKRAAMEAHRSQLPDGTPESLFPAGIVDALLREEWYRVVWGPELPSESSDPFAGLG